MLRLLKLKKWDQTLSRRLESSVYHEIMLQILEPIYYNLPYTGGQHIASAVCVMCLDYQMAVTYISASFWKTQQRNKWSKKLLISFQDEVFDSLKKYDTDSSCT